MPITDLAVHAAPPVLGLANHALFRAAVLAHLAELPTGSSLAVDLADTRRIDSAGLTALVELRGDAALRGHALLFRNARDELRYHMALARLDALLEVPS